jgi:hypothetical protein
MFKLNNSLCYTFFATFLFYGIAFAMDQSQVLVTPAEIRELRQSPSSNPHLSSEPIQVDIYMKRSDGLRQTLYDSYKREDEESPITIKEVFKNFRLREVLPALLSRPKTASLFFTVTVSMAGKDKDISKPSILEKSQLLDLLETLD